MNTFRIPDERFAGLTEFPFRADYGEVTVEGIERHSLARGEDGARL
jgi:hypothetical protein